MGTEEGVATNAINSFAVWHAITKWILIGNYIHYLKFWCFEAQRRWRGISDLTSHISLCTIDGDGTIDKVQVMDSTCKHTCTAIHWIDTRVNVHILYNNMAVKVIIDIVGSGGLQKYRSRHTLSFEVHVYCATHEHVQCSLPYSPICTVYIVCTYVKAQHLYNETYLRTCTYLK